MADDGAPNGNALLLPAGQLVWQIPQPVVEVQDAEDFPQMLSVGSAVVEQQGECDVFFNIEHRDEVVKLINQPDLPAAENGQDVYKRQVPHGQRNGNR